MRVTTPLIEWAAGGEVVGSREGMGRVDILPAWWYTVEARRSLRGGRRRCHGRAFRQGHYAVLATIVQCALVTSQTMECNGGNS